MVTTSCGPRGIATSPTRSRAGSRTRSGTPTRRGPCSSAAAIPCTSGAGPTPTRSHGAPPSAVTASTASRDRWARARSSCSRSSAVHRRAVAPRSTPRSWRRASGYGPEVDQQWDIQLYNRPWYEALDFRHRVTCLNHALAHRSDDGRVRIVIANRDPGCVNWLDTEGRTDVLATIRWWHPPTVPTVDHEVVALDSLADLPPVDTAARRDELRRRTVHTAWRYRT